MTKLTIVIGLTLALSGLAAGCQGPDQGDAPNETRVTKTPEPREAVGKALMLALGQAKNFHGKADVYARSGNVEQAIVEVERVLEISFPKASPEAEDVYADARARLSKLLLGSGRIDRALEIADEGIARSTRKSFFVANLHTVRGEILEAMANRIEDGEPEQAKRLRLDAIAAFDESIAINEDLQRQLAPEVE